MNKEIMNIAEVSRYLGFSQRKIYQLIKEGKIPVSKIGGQYRFIKDEIYLWLRRSRPVVKNS
ncbi:helix-turn-helix domain-containing protein [bacterium]|nr:helix-turn-helix domain-containing protein [bacterium]